MQAKASQARMGMIAMALGTAFALAACSGGEPQLMNLTSSDGPDEFAIVPPKPLQMPKDFASLPPPTPGGSNLTDPTPEADAIVALGGRPQARGTGVDAQLFAHAGRFGVENNIRQTLAAEDLDWRRDNKGRILERLMNVTVYYKAYEKLSLDQHAELARWRKAGARTPSAPPSPEALKR